MTDAGILSRLGAYKKEKISVIAITVLDASFLSAKHAEDDLIKAFNEMFTLSRGREYFECDSLLSATILFNNVLSKF